MLRLNPYLNFPGTTEEAFRFYKSVFGGDFYMMQRFSEVPGVADNKDMREEDLKKIMHVSLKVGDNVLMGTDALESMHQTVKMGTNITLSLHPESKEEADRLFGALSEGGEVGQPMQDMFWGDYWGMFTDKFGVQWMVNYSKQQ